MPDPVMVARPRQAKGSTLTMSELDDQAQAQFTAINQALTMATAALVGIGDTASQPVAAVANSGALYINTETNYLQRSNGSSWANLWWMGTPPFHPELVRPFVAGPPNTSTSAVGQYGDAHHDDIFILPGMSGNLTWLVTADPLSKEIAFVRLSTGENCALGIGLAAGDGSFLMFEIWQADQATAPAYRVSTRTAFDAAPAVLVTIPCFNLPPIIWMKYAQNLEGGTPVYDFSISPNGTGWQIVASAPDTGFATGCVGGSVDDDTTTAVAAMSIISHTGEAFP